jgi:hypothetical protein
MAGRRRDFLRRWNIILYFLSYFQERRRGSLLDRGPCLPTKSSICRERSDTKPFAVSLTSPLHLMLPYRVCDCNAVSFFSVVGVQSGRDYARKRVLRMHMKD